MRVRLRQRTPAAKCTQYMVSGSLAVTFLKMSTSGKVEAMGILKLLLKVKSLWKLLKWNQLRRYLTDVRCIFSGITSPKFPSRSELFFLQIK